MITLIPEQQQDVAQRFQALATRWIATTRYRSNTQALRNHPVYQELVALGEPVVPLILMELGRQLTVSWFVVLTGITGENPVPPALAGQVDATARAWIDWGRQRGAVPHREAATGPSSLDFKRILTEDLRGSPGTNTNPNEETPCTD